MIQHKVDDSVLKVDAIRVTNAKADEVTISIDSWVEASDSIHATIDAFEADMMIEGQAPFAKLQMPQTKTGLSIVNITQTINIGDEKYKQPFIDYNKALLGSESVKMVVEGRTKVRVKGLRAESVTFKKIIELKGTFSNSFLTKSVILTNPPGLNSFKGLEVTDATVNLKPDSNGNNFVGFATIPNPSVLSLEIGNATFANFFDGKDIGELFIDNMSLVPGNNNVSVRATIEQTPVLGALGKRPVCEEGPRNGILAFELAGKRVVNLQNETLPYYEAALASAKQQTEINVGKAAEAGIGFNPAVCGKNS